MNRIERRMQMALVLAALLGSRAAVQADASAPNIVVIVADTLRADRVGADGNPRGLTPFLDDLARRGTTFANTYASSSWTYPSVASLFTSRYPSQHGVISYEKVLAPTELTLAKYLTARGYVAGGFSANFRLTSANGYGQGFTFWSSYLAEPGQAKPTGALIRGKALEWLHARPGEVSAPLFLYLHYMETHAPYEPTEPYRGRFAQLSPTFDATSANATLMKPMLGLRGLSSDQIQGLASLYDAAVATLDGELRLAFDELTKLGILNNAIVVFTADHGEEFGEHGELQHGHTLFQPSIRIPLIIVAPGMPSGQVLRQNVSLLDIAPTVLDLAGIPIPASFEGRSLVPAMRAGPSATDATRPTGDVLIEREPLTTKWDQPIHSRALISDTFKVVVTPKGEREAYDLSQDPDERSPRKVAADDDGSAALLLQRMEQKRALLHERTTQTHQTVPLDEATKEKLRALGYQP